MRYLFVFIFIILLLAVCSDQNNKMPISTASEEALDNFLKGRELMENLRLADSREYFTKAIELDSNFALAYLFIARTSGRAEDLLLNISKAESLIDKVSPGEKLLIQSNVAGTQNNFVEQTDIIIKLAELYPEDERAHDMLGNLYFAQQKYDEALVAYQKSLELNEKFPAPYNMLGYLYRYRGEYDKAEEVFQKYTELIPTDPNPYDSYADLLTKMGKYGISIEMYYKALELDPNFMASHLGIAYNLCLLNKHKDARDQLEEMLIISENEFEKQQALFGYAISYIDEGNLKKAIDYYYKIFEISKQMSSNATMSDNLANIATLYLELGKIDKAEEIAREALELILSSDLSDDIKATAERNAIFGKARLDIARGEFKAAQEKADQFYAEAETRENPFDQWRAHRLLGMISLEQDNYQPALDELVRSNLRNPYNLYRIGMAYEGLGNKEKAIEYYDKAAHFNTFSTNAVSYALIRKKASLKLFKLGKDS